MTVPGAVSGWMALHERFGRAPLDDDPVGRDCASRRTGFPVSEITVARVAGQRGRALRTDAGARRDVSAGWPGAPAGEIFRNPDLARTLRAIAADGGDAFYRGEIAEAHPRMLRRIAAAPSTPRICPITTPSG